MSHWEPMGSGPSASEWTKAERILDCKNRTMVSSLSPARLVSIHQATCESGKIVYFQKWSAESSVALGGEAALELVLHCRRNGALTHCERSAK